MNKRPNSLKFKPIRAFQKKELKRSPASSVKREVQQGSDYRR